MMNAAVAEKYTVCYDKKRVFDSFFFGMMEFYRLAKALIRYNFIP
jgi:hypothetical protein